MGPLAARYAGFGTGHGNGVRTPYSKFRVRPGCVVGSCVFCGRFESKWPLEVCALAVGQQNEGIRKVCASITARFASPATFASPGTARWVSGRAAIPKFAMV